MLADNEKIKFLLFTEQTAQCLSVTFEDFS